jgi:hypothetical protein
MPARTARNALNRRRRATGMQMMASAACVATIVLAGFIFLFLQAPVRKITRLPPPPADVPVPTQVAAPVQLPERLGSKQQSLAAQAQVPGVLSSHSNEPANAKGNPPPSVRIAAPASRPNPTGLATTAQANTAPLQPNDTHRELVTLEHSGVNIRSAPSGTSRIVGSAPKGARFEVINRNGHWLQIESDGVKGWISGHFVGPSEQR